jgi:hypothetical protein
MSQILLMLLKGLFLNDFGSKMFCLAVRMGHPGGGGRKVPKKCHVLFEWPLIMIKQRDYLLKRLSLICEERESLFPFYNTTQTINNHCQWQSLR